MYTSIVILLLFTVHTISAYWERHLDWTVTNRNGTIKIPASVPGGIYTDLQRAGVIDYILYGYNDVLTRWVAYDSWTYTGKFKICKESLSNENVNLVFEGVDTVAYVEVNDKPVGTTDNMFTRYVFNVKPFLQEGDNEVKIMFESPVEAAKARSDKYFTAPACVPEVYKGECHANQLRKMQASFGWDWGPAFPSVGIWKPAYIQFYKGAIITAITTHIKKANDQWKVHLHTYIETKKKANAWGGNIRINLKVNNNQELTFSKETEAEIHNDGSGLLQLNFTVSEGMVDVWWPNGYGDQPLYQLTVTINSDSLHPNQSFSKSVHIGFRTLEFIEADASTVIAEGPGRDGLTFYFKVNGYPIFMKGSNWIPSHILPEQGAKKMTVDILLLSAKSSHMNMLRVWGGGVYESDYFYKKCDELGILIWQDFLFACSMYPVDPKFIISVKKEIQQNVKRLQHHPSIAIWAGNNENEVALRGNWYYTNSLFEKYKEEYVKLYVDTIKPIVEMLDPGRHYLVSSPTNGKESEQEGYIAENPYSPHYGDTHYYNYIADNWNPAIYPKTRFASEYGFQSLPSIATLKTATNDTKDFNLESDFLKHRQHSPNGYTWVKNQIYTRMNLDENDEKYFEKFVFYSQIFQAYAIKTETEFYRQSQQDWYTMGALYWQLNDVWQAPSWSGIEYGLRWKMLHYFSRSFFAPVLVSPRLLPSQDIEVYLINDRFVPITSAVIIVDYFLYDDLKPVKSEEFPASVEALSAKKQRVLTPWVGYDINTQYFLKFTLKANGVKSSPANYVFPQPLKDVQNLKKKPIVNIKVTESKKSTSDKPLYIVDIQVDTVVLFLWLETPYEGHFKENGFIVTDPFIQVKFKSKDVIAPADLQSSITYMFYSN